MSTVTVSSKGQIAIPKAVREELNIREGCQLTLVVKGHKLVLSKNDAWKRLRGAGGPDTMDNFAAFRKEEREREEPRP